MLQKYSDFIRLVDVPRHQRRKLIFANPFHRQSIRAHHLSRRAVQFLTVRSRRHNTQSLQQQSGARQRHAAAHRTDDRYVPGHFCVAQEQGAGQGGAPGRSGRRFGALDAGRDNGGYEGLRNAVDWTKERRCWRFGFLYTMHCIGRR
jgi:hypothetical protein